MSVVKVQKSSNVRNVSPKPTNTSILAGSTGPQGIPGAINSDITTIRTVTNAEYLALTPDPLTLYIIK